LIFILFYPSFYSIGNTWKIILNKFHSESTFSVSFYLIYSILIINEVRFFLINSPIIIKISFKKGLKSKCLKFKIIQTKLNIFLS
jgi:hypothetical protein